MLLEGLVIPVSFDAGLLLKGIDIITGALGKVVSSTDEWGNSLDVVQDSLGGTSKEAAGLALAAKKINMPVEQAVGLIDKMAKGLQDAKGGLGATGKLLQTMGINALDANGNIRPFSDLIGEVASKIAAMPDGLDKTNIEMQLFGRAGAEAGDLMNQLANGGMANVIAQADAMGLAIDPAVVKAYDASWATLQMTLQGFAIQAGAAIFPFFTEILNDLNAGDPAAAWEAIKTKIMEALLMGNIWLDSNPTAITDFINGLLSGLTGAMNGAPDTVTGQLAQSLVNKLSAQLAAVDWGGAVQAIWEGLSKVDTLPFMDVGSNWGIALRKGIIDQVAEMRNEIADIVADIVNNFNAWMARLTLPSWLTPGSPTPLENGLRGIGSAMSALSGAGMPAFSMANASGGAPAASSPAFEFDYNRLAMILAAEVAKAVN